MEINKIKQDAWLGFNMLGLFLLVAILFVTLFGVAYIVSGEKVPFIIFTIILIPLACFITAYGFKNTHSWAWYLAFLISTLLLVTGLLNLVELSLSGVILTLISICIFSWLTKVRTFYMTQNA